MRTEILGPLAFRQLKVVLEPGETFVSEAGAMVRMSAHLGHDVTIRSKGRGGIVAGLKRLVSGDSFFLATYTAVQEIGEVVVAPPLMGEVAVVDLDSGVPWLCAGGSYLGHGGGIAIEPRWQGLKGLFTGESMFFLEATGRGPLAVGAFGQIEEMAVDGSVTIDTGHVVAYETTLSYEITKAGRSWLHSFLAGEGLVLRFSGRGRVLMQSHNPSEFGQSVGPHLPHR